MRVSALAKRPSSGEFQILVEILDHERIVLDPFRDRIQKPLFELRMGIEFIDAVAGRIVFQQVILQTVCENQLPLDFEEFAVVEGFLGGDGQLGVALRQMSDFVSAGHGDSSSI